MSLVEQEATILGFALGCRGASERVSVLDSKTAALRAVLPSVACWRGALVAGPQNPRALRLRRFGSGIFRGLAISDKGIQFLIGRLDHFCSRSVERRGHHGQPVQSHSSDLGL